MGSASDKARFYLEQSVPELKEYERKKIFSTTEITSISRKRSDFEHKVNARGSTPSDYARYAEFEINLDSLRRKRVKRLGVKGPVHTGQRRIFFILDRGTRKFPGDVGLWMQSLDYARNQKAHKRLSRTLTNVLRLHPTKPELWIYAAQFVVDEQANMADARSYMQRGLRFCKNVEKMWLEYMKLEVSFIAKIAARRDILGIGESRSTLVTITTLDDTDADLVQVPNFTVEDFDSTSKNHEVADEDALQKFDSTPLMSGAIPIAIFEAAMAHFRNRPALGKAFFDICTEFTNIQGLRRVSNHILEAMMKSSGNSWEIQSCYIKAPVGSLEINSPESPAALGVSIGRLKESWSVVDQKWQLAADLMRWFQTFLDQEGLDPALRRIIADQCRSLGQVPQPVGLSEPLNDDNDIE